MQSKSGLQTQITVTDEFQSSKNIKSTSKPSHCSVVSPEAENDQLQLDKLHKFSYYFPKSNYDVILSKLGKLQLKKQIKLKNKLGHQSNRIVSIKQSMRQ